MEGKKPEGEAVEVKSDQAEQQDPAEEIVQNPALSAKEEEALAAFLGKVQKACGQDKSVPDFVGDQVNEWLQELNQEKVDSKSDKGPENEKNSNEKI